MEHVPAPSYWTDDGLGLLVKNPHYRQEDHRGVMHAPLVFSEPLTEIVLALALATLYPGGLLQLRVEPLTEHMPSGVYSCCLPQELREDFPTVAQDMITDFVRDRFGGLLTCQLFEMIPYSST